MDKSFFRSKEFVASAIIATIVIAGGAIALGAGGFSESGIRSHRACSAPTLEGPVLNVDPTDETRLSGDHAVRTVSYVLDNLTFSRGAIDGCTSVGHVKLVPSTNDRVRVTFTLDAEGRDAETAVKFTQINADFRLDGTTLRLGAWEGVGTQSGGVFWGDRSTQVRVLIEVPENATYTFKGRADVGFVAAERLVLDRADMATDVGDIDLSDVHMQGDVNLRSDVGDITGEFLSFQTGTVDARVDVGDVRLRIPERADIGYAVTGRTDVGSVHVDIGPAESTTRNDDGPSESVQTKSKGYDEKTIKVTIKGVVDVGGVTIQTQ